MAKGLSVLQGQILILILQRGGMVFVADILKSMWGRGEEKIGQSFSRRTLGTERYGQIHASLSRSIERLRLRGLVRIFKDVAGGAGTIIALTGYGGKMAKWLEYRATAS